mgnify:FL=1
MSGQASTVTVRRQIAKKDYTRVRLILFTALVAALLLTAIFAEWICPYDPYEQDLSNALQPPCAAHPFGTDRYGRDMLSRIIVGSRASIFSALALVAIIAVAGTVIGVICGYYGGVVDGILMRVSDVFLAFPSLIFAMAIAAVLNGGIQNAVLALAVISWPKYARLARGQTLAVRQSEYIAAARLSGSSSFRIILRHVIPNIAGTVLVTAMLDIGVMMMEIAALSFLGLGAQPPTAEWGSMMSSGRSMLQTYPWVVLTPGLAIFVSVVLFNLLGDTVRDWMAPGSARKKRN